MTAACQNCQQEKRTASERYQETLARDDIHRKEFAEIYLLVPFGFCTNRNVLSRSKPMKRSVSNWNRCYEVVHEVRKVVALMIVAPLCLSAFSASATEGRISFSGQITEASCAVLPATGSVAGAHTQRINVSAHMSIVVNTSQNACAASVIPFSTQYQPLPVSLSTGNRSGAGVLTLTYQ
ncbi:MAG: hypothetical protein ABWZ39_16575 [Pseudomonas caspiana]